MSNQVQRKTACMDDLEIHAFREAKTGRLRITGVTIDGQLCVPTLSFWRAIFAEVGLASCVGPRFDEYTWFLRLRNSHPYLVFRYVVATDKHGSAMLLGEPRQATEQLPEFDVNDDAVEPATQNDTMEDFVAERLSHQWRALRSRKSLSAKTTVVSIPDGLVDSPAGHIKPSLN